MDLGSCQHDVSAFMPLGLNSSITRGHFARPWSQKSRSARFSMTGHACPCHHQYHLHLHFLNDLKVHIRYSRYRSGVFLFSLEETRCYDFSSPFFNTYIAYQSHVACHPLIWAFTLILDTYLIQELVTVIIVYMHGVAVLLVGELTVK